MLVNSFRTRNLDSPHLWEGFPGGSVCKEATCNAGNVDSILGLGTSPGEESGNPSQYSCLGNPMDRGAWWASSWSLKESDMTEGLSMSWNTFGKDGSTSARTTVGINRSELTPPWSQQPGGSRILSPYIRDKKLRSKTQVTGIPRVPLRMVSVARNRKCDSNNKRNF